MTKEYKYIFEKNSKKHNCPKCGKKRFVRYINIETNNLLPSKYGKCDREVNCSYYHTPYEDNYTKIMCDQRGEKEYKQPSIFNLKQKKIPFKKVTFIPVEVLNKTLLGYEQNNFIQNLLYNVPFPFKASDLEKVISLYRLGTVNNGYRIGATTFPFIDINNNIRTIQVKQFDKNNNTTSTDFLHSIIDKYYNKIKKPLPEWLKEYNKNEKKVSCLFGEHLLKKYPNSPIALVEAPKTAIYGTLYFSNLKQANKLIWLAVYNLSSLNLNKCKSLEGRNVYLFPDLSKEGKTFKLWSNKAIEIESKLKDSRFIVSNLLELNANVLAKKKGCDIADYLINMDWRNFINYKLNDYAKY